MGLTGRLADSEISSLGGDSLDCFGHFEVEVLGGGLGMWIGVAREGKGSH